MVNILRRLASQLPIRYQQEMKRLYYARQIRKEIFKADEPEFDMLGAWVCNGDFVLDIGANIGHYTSRLSKLVGISGRVIGFEPVPETFEILTANMERTFFNNITLLNVAVSDKTAILGMSIPKFNTGLNNYYMAHLTHDTEKLSVLSLPIDALNINEPVKLVKIDVEGHEISVLKGMKQLLKRDHPILIVEGDSGEVAFYLQEFGYSFEKIHGSPNRIYRCSK
jgi:FkbM family methyltransferase